MFRYMRQKSYCYRIDTSLTIILDIHKRDIGTGIVYISDYGMRLYMKTYHFIDAY